MADNADQCSTLLTNPYNMAIHIALAPSVLIILVLMFLERRTSYRLDLFHGRPGLHIPIRLLDGYSNRWGIAAALGSITNVIVTLMTKALFNAEYPIWTNVFIIHLMALEGAVVCFPILGCITSRHKLFGSVVELLYTTVWFAYQLYVLIQTGICAIANFDSYRDALDAAGVIYSQRYGLIVADIFSRLPMLGCLVVVIVKLSQTLFRAIKRRQYTEQIEMSISKPQDRLYTINLLNGDTCEENRNSSEKMCPKCCPKWRWNTMPGFRYPVLVVATVFVMGILLYLLAVTTLTRLLFQMNVDDASLTSERNVQYVSPISEALQVPLAFFDDLMTFFRVSIIFGVIAAVLCCGFNMYFLLLNYKKHMLRLYKGDVKFIPETARHLKPEVYMTSGVRYMGSQIAGTVYAFTSTFLAVFLPMAIAGTVIMYYDRIGQLSVVLNLLQWLIYPAIMFILFYVQAFLVRRFMLQPRIKESDKHRPLAVDNRRCYETLTYYMFFLNVGMGLIMYMGRVVIGIVLGLFMIGRMDRTLLPKGFERYDKSHNRYISMLMVHYTHNHPLMLTFCGLLCDGSSTNRTTEATTPTDFVAADNPIYGIYDPRTNTIRGDNTGGKAITTKARRKWLLAYTLMKNPALQCLRKHSLVARMSVEQPDEGQSLISQGRQLLHQLVTRNPTHDRYIDSVSVQ